MLKQLLTFTHAFPKSHSGATLRATTCKSTFGRDTARYVRRMHTNPQQQVSDPSNASSTVKELPKSCTNVRNSTEEKVAPFTAFLRRWIDDKAMAGQHQYSDQTGAITAGSASGPKDNPRVPSVWAHLWYVYLIEKCPVSILILVR
jgi:hypothetical protein